MDDLVNEKLLTEMGLEPKTFSTIINNFYEKDSNSAVEVWYLFNLALWKQRFDAITP